MTSISSNLLIVIGFEKDMLKELIKDTIFDWNCLPTGQSDFFPKIINAYL